MVEEYIVFDNGSKEVLDMENFFKENGVNYRTIYKPAESSAKIFPPKDLPYYDVKGFNFLKTLILEQQKIEIENLINSDS